MTEKEIKEDFNKILKFNKGRDWNNPTQRQTIVDGLRFCANRHLKEYRKRVLDALDNFIKKYPLLLKEIEELKKELKL